MKGAVERKLVIKWEEKWIGWQCLWKRGRLYEGYLEWRNIFGWMGMIAAQSGWWTKETEMEEKKATDRQRMIKVLWLGGLLHFFHGCNFENGDGRLEANQHLELKRERKAALLHRGGMRILYPFVPNGGRLKLVTSNSTFTLVKADT